MEKEESNMLIAKFMGATPCELKCKGKCGSYLIPQFERHFTSVDMKYHTSYDWLMPVVESIQHKWEINICRVMDFEILSTGYNGYKTNVRIYVMLLKNGNSYHTIKTTAIKRIDAIYTAVIAFIEWYNEQLLTLNQP